MGALGAKRAEREDLIVRTVLQDTLDIVVAAPLLSSGGSGDDGALGVGDAQGWGRDGGGDFGDISIVF